ncbi:MAG: hypothetical protein AB1498_01845 [bacterium]
MVSKFLWKGGLFAIALMFCSVSPIFSQSNDAGALIDQVIEAYGGRGNVLSVKAYRMEAVIQTHIRGENGSVIRVSEGPAKLKVIVRYPNNMEIRLLDGENALRGFAPGKLALVQGPLRDSMVLQAARANIPWLLDKMRAEIRLTKSKDNSPVLEVPIGEGMFLKAFVDIKTHLIIRAETVSEGEMKLGFAADYSDFRKVNNVLFPFKEENYASGSHTATTTVNKIMLNPSGEYLGLLFSK